tara:strand:+ start:406 stop:1158 length:753 start_codon:yes stop_codon:yes gene_type:complete
MLYKHPTKPDSKCNWVMDSLAKGWQGNEDHFWGFIGSNEKNINDCKLNNKPWYFWDMPYYGRWYKDIQEDIYWRVSKNHIHYKHTKDYPSDRFEQWNVKLKEYSTGDKILICPSSETMTRYVTGLSVQEWLDFIIKELEFYTDRPYEIRYKPRANGTSGPSVAEIPFAQQAQDTHCVVTCISLCALEAQLLGIPTICHKDSFASDVSGWHIESINNPKRVDRMQWFYNLAYSQFTHSEIESGLAEEILNA